MQLEWISYPITQYTISGLGLISSLTLWASSKAEIRRVRRTVKNSLAELERGVTDLNASIDDVRRTKTTAPEPAPVAAPVPAPAPAAAPISIMQGLNLTRRTQILRMKRRGEGPQSIAAALQIPVGEVSLILKMEQLQGASLEPAAAPAPRLTRGVL